MDERDQLRQKFAALRPTAVTHVSDPARRTDYKGNRARLNLRVPAEMMDLLSLLRTVDGGEINTFCVTVLDGALKARLEQVRGNFSDAEWDVLVRCARGGAAKQPLGGPDGSAGGGG